MIVALSGQFIPEAKNFDLSNCMDEKEATRILFNRFGSDYHIGEIRRQIIFIDGNYQAYYVIAFKDTLNKYLAINCVNGEFCDLDLLNRKENSHLQKILRSRKYDLREPSQDGMPRFNSKDR
jgi:hypothetical protein